MMKITGFNKMTVIFSFVYLLFVDHSYESFHFTSLVCRVSVHFDEPDVGLDIGRLVLDPDARAILKYSKI